MKEIRYSFDTDDDIEKTTEQSMSDDYNEEDAYEDEFEDNNFENELNFLSKDEDNNAFKEDEDDSSDNGENINETNNAIFNDEADDKIENEIAERTAVKRKKAGKSSRNKKYINNIKLKRLLVVLAVIIGTAFCIAASPVFAVDKIVMNDLHYFTKDEICSQIGLFSGTNGIFFNKLKAENILEGSPYISSVKISFKLPNTMIVSISENKIIGYIKYLGSYLYIDRTGCVLDIKKETEESLPIIEGLDFSSFTINKEIPVENLEAFQAALTVSNSMSKYGVLDDAVSINVSDTDNLYAYINNVKVLLGDNSRMEEKIKTMAEAAKEIPEEDMGTLDLTDLSKPIIFKYTT